MAGAFETIIYSKVDNIGFITLNRPDVMNVYNLKMRDEIYDVLQAVRDDDEVRVCILNGAGDKAFCAGADLTEFLTAPSPLVARRVRWERDVWGLFLGINKPLIAALHGYVFGSGMEIALCCDIRIASDDAQFALPEAGLGIIPAAAGSQTLPRTIGVPGAMEMLLGGKRVGAREALRMKLVNKVVSGEKLAGEAETFARQIASLNPVLASYARQAVNRGLELSLERGLEMEAMLGRELAALHDT
jgi:enoyl-CoA hydratase/carnithine racemase